jgi:hypothetical protein
MRRDCTPCHIGTGTGLASPPNRPAKPWSWMYDSATASTSENMFATSGCSGTGTWKTTTPVTMRATGRVGRATLQRRIGLCLRDERPVACGVAYHLPCMPTDTWPYNVQVAS